MLPKQCLLSGILVPNFAKEWINIKNEFIRIEGKNLDWDANDLLQMLEYYKLDHFGKLHSGKDDVVNIKNIIEKMSYKAILMQNSV